MALPHRWFRLWLVSLLSFGALTSPLVFGQITPGSLTHTAMTLNYSLSGGNVVVNWTISGASGSTGYTGLLGTTNVIDAYSAYGGSASNGSGTFSTPFNSASDYYVQVSNNGADNSDSARVKIYTGSSPVAISPTNVNPLKTGQAVTFTATGGSGDYNWTAIGNPIIAGSGSTRNVTWNEEGVWTLTVSANGGSASATVYVAKEITVRIPVKNGNSVGSGIIVAGIGKKNGVGNPNWVTAALQPGQSDYVAVDGVKTGDVVTVDIVRVGVKKDADGNLIPGNPDPSQGPVDYVIIKTDTIDHSATQSGDHNLPESSSTVNIVKGTLKDEEKSVWTPTDSTDAAKDGTMKQGFDKTVSALDAINATLKARLGDTGGAGTDVSGIESRLDTANEHLQKLSEQADAVTAAVEGNPAAGVAEAGGAAAASNLSNALPSAGRAGSITIAKSQPNFTISMPAQFGGKQFDLDPFRADRLGPAIDWFRVAMAWACIVIYGIWISKEVGEWMKGASAVRQAQGNAVVGGTGGQATALIAATAITVAVSVFTVAMVSWLAGDIVSLSTMLAQIGVNPMSGAPSNVAWMLDRVFPIATMVTCLVARMSFNFYAAKIFAVAMTVIRWIVP